jgi:hypothetical protein
MMVGNDALAHRRGEERNCVRSIRARTDDNSGHRGVRFRLVRDRSQISGINGVALLRCPNRKLQAELSYARWQPCYLVSMGTG